MANGSNSWLLSLYWGMAQFIVCGNTEVAEASIVYTTVCVMPEFSYERFLAVLFRSHTTGLATETQIMRSSWLKTTTKSPKQHDPLFPTEKPTKIPQANLGALSICFWHIYP